MKTANKSNIWAAACYIPPLFAPLLFLKRRDNLVFFHAKQAMGTWAICALSLGIALLPGSFFALIKWPVSLTGFILFIYYLIRYLIDVGMGRAIPQLPLGEQIDNLIKS